MKKFLCALMALVCIASCACAQTYTSANGYTLELPDGWLALTVENYEQILAAVGEAELEELGVTADDLSTILGIFQAMRMEYVFSGDGEANMLCVTAAQEMTREEIEASMQSNAQTYEAMGFEDVLSGWARFGQREMACVVFSVEGQAVANYIFAEDGTMYSFTFTGVAAQEVSAILTSLQTVETDGDNAPFPMDGSLGEPRA